MQLAEKSNRLHLGSGKNYLPGWTNVDLFSSVRADIYCDVTHGMPFKAESFDIIYASHILEHVHRHMILYTLSYWRDLLREGGILRLAVPNFGAVVEWYKKTGDLQAVMGLLYGGQNHPRNNHFVTFDEKSLTDALSKVGFRYITRWNWKQTDHAGFDDYSQCFLPHMEKENGMLMSLNVEAVK